MKPGVAVESSLQAVSVISMNGVKVTHSDMTAQTEIDSVLTLCC